MRRTLTIALVLVAAIDLPIHGQQADPAALYARGITWEAFLDAAEARKELWHSNAERASAPDALVERLRAAGDGLRILAVAVDACSDSVSTVPYLAALASKAGVPLRIVDSTVGRAVMDAHHTPDGRGATPTIVLLRGNDVAGVFVERPRALQDWMLSDFAQSLPSAERVERKMSWYDWDRGASTLAEIVALAEGARPR